MLSYIFAIKGLVIYLASLVNNIFQTNGYVKQMILYSLSGTILSPIIGSIINFIVYLFTLTFISKITISSKQQQKTFNYVQYYIQSKYNNNEIYVGLIGVKDKYNDITNNNLKKINKTFTLGLNWHIMFENYTPILVHIGQTTITEHNSSRTEYTINLYCIYPFYKLFDRHDIWKKFIAKSRNEHKKQINTCLKQIKLSNYRAHYNSFTYIKKEQVLNKTNLVYTKEMLSLDDKIKNFMNNKKESIYKVCIYGPPGTGKSNMAYKIALTYNLPIYNIEFGKPIENIIDVFSDVTKGIVVMDEIDQFIGDNNIKIGGNDNESINGKINMATFHNMLDNMINKKKLIIYFTTNNIKILGSMDNGSIIRPERISTIIKFGYINHNFVNTMLNNIFKTDTNYINEYNIKTIKMTPAKIINIVKNCNHNKELVIDNINKLINKFSTKHIVCKTDIEQYINVLFDKYNVNITEKYRKYIINILYVNNIETFDEMIEVLQYKNYSGVILKYPNASITDTLKIKNMIDILKYYDIHDIIKKIINVGDQNGLVFGKNFYTDMGKLFNKSGVICIDDFKKLAGDKENDMDVGTVNKLKLTELCEKYIDLL